MGPVLQTIGTSLGLFISLPHVITLKDRSGASQPLLTEPLHSGGSINSEKPNGINSAPFCIGFRNKFPPVQACSLKALVKCTFLRFSKILYFTKYAYLLKPKYLKALYTKS